MKIAIIFPKDSEALFNCDSTRTFGGASVQLYNISKELKNYQDIEVFSLIPSYQKTDFNDERSFNLIKVFNEKDNLIIKIIKFHKEIKRIKPVAIIQHGLTLESCLLAKYCNFFKVKFVFMFAHDVEIEGIHQSTQKKCNLFKMLLNNSYKLISQNSYQEKKIKELYRKKTIIIKNGFILQDQCDLIKKDILWVARSDNWKNPFLFFDLAENFPQENFIMICPYSNNISKEEYNNLKDRGEKVKNLKFIEFVEYKDINEYFKKAKLFINTSDYEGFPQTFIQASMNSVPIISLNSNPDNFLDKYVCGFCANGNFEAMREKIRFVLKKGDLWREMSDNAYNYAKENHDIKINVRKLLKEIK